MLALVAGLLAAVVIAPFAAALVSAVSWRVPFPRIFDRVVMITLAAAMIAIARPLGLFDLLRDGFADFRRAPLMLLCGFALAMLTVGSLFVIAFELKGSPVGPIVARAARFVLAAAAIALIEEGFFRAILLGGIVRDFGRPTALVASSAIYAIAHLVRAPARFYLTGLHPLAGLANLAASADRIIHPGDGAAMVIGLFLLGMVLGAAFLLTGRVWFSVGMHAGFVLGAKTWPMMAHGAALPRWLAGPGPVPLIAAPASWALALATLLVLLLLRKRISQ
jgi:membrane protease YdiL (CAAX protease family)